MTGELTTSASLLQRLDEYRVVDEDDDDPILLTKDGHPVDTWREGFSLLRCSAGSVSQRVF